MVGSIFTAPRECLCEVGHLIEGGLLIIEEILQCMHVNVKCKVWYLLSKTFVTLITYLHVEVSKRSGVEYLYNYNFFV